MDRIPVWLLLTIAFSTQHSGQTSTPTSGLRGVSEGAAAREVLEIMRLYDVAQLHNDGAWFRRTFAEDYVWMGPDGVVVTKSEYVRDLESRDLTWASVEVKDMRVRVYGDTAIATGRFFGKGRYKGNLLDERQRFTSVLIKRSGRWQVISEHCSKLNASEQ
jgi:ketosteroid isomerase-like protein